MEKIFDPGNITSTLPPTFADEQSNIYIKSQTTSTDFPEQPLGQRLFVRFKDLPDGYERVESGVIGGATMYRAVGSQIAISEEQFAKVLKEMAITPQLVEVAAVGEMKETGIKAGDIIRVYANQCEARVKINDLDYLVYSERSIISKVK